MNGKNSSKAGGFVILIIGIAAFFLLRGFSKVLSVLFVALATIAVIFLIIFGVLVLISAFKGGEPNASSSSSAVLAKGRTALGALRAVTPRIMNAEIRGLGEQIAASSGNIISSLQGNEDGIISSIQLFEYYLPELAEILEKYVKAEKSGAATPELTENLKTHLTKISAAVNTQFAGVAGASEADLTAEIEAMLSACKDDGLIDELSAKYEDKETE